MNPGQVPARERFSWSRIPPVVTVVCAIAILYLGKDVLLPIAVALLLSFALAPIVSFLRRRGFPRIVAVIASVVLAFAVMGLVGLLAATQISSLAAGIPTYQANIVTKIRSLQELGGEGGIIDRITGIIERVGAEIQEGAGSNPDAGEPEQKPLPVEVVSDRGAWETLNSIVMPLVSPFASFGLIVVVVVFMLLDRENLRDRFIRLVGYSDLHRTTEALEDAARRVGRYLLMQLVVNTLYAVPVTIGLFFIGIPNAILWGVLALVLRFVPYIGPAIAMLLPLMLALAVDPGWSLLLWTAALFLGLELVSNNVIEPWLYGSQTGLSSLAIIIAAIFWTWLWGPLGLLLSTPLTVCLVVLGKYVPQFEFFEVLLGNEPVLPAEKRLYQRLLAGDADEATDTAETYLEERYLVDFYGRIGIPALLLAEEDRQRGILPEDRRATVAENAAELVENLNDIAEEEEEEEDEDDAPPPRAAGDRNGGRKPANGAAEDHEEVDLPDGSGRHVVCLGGRGDMDDAASAMLAQVLEVQGAQAGVVPHPELTARAVRDLDLKGVDTVVVTFLNANSLAQARQAVRRLKRAGRTLRVGLYMPGRTAESPEAAATLAKEMSADFLSSSLSGAVIEALSEAAPVKLRASRSRVAPPRGKTSKAARRTTPVS